jgi:hypothetical protein
MARKFFVSLRFSKLIWRMRLSMKHRFGLLAGLLFCGALAGEPVPIEDRDAFEKEYLACIKSGLEEDCFLVLFSSHLCEDIKNPEEASRKHDAYYRNILKISPGSIYAIHPLDKTIKAGIVDSRTYLVEHRTNGFFLFFVNFVKQKGKWYILGYDTYPESEKINKFINLPSLLVK